jgi:hypothetical protein
VSKEQLTLAKATHKKHQTALTDLINMGKKAVRNLDKGVNDFNNKDVEKKAPSSAKAKKASVGAATGASADKAVKKGHLTHEMCDKIALVEAIAMSADFTPADSSQDYLQNWQVPLKFTFATSDVEKHASQCTLSCSLLFRKFPGLPERKPPNGRTLRKLPASAHADADKLLAFANAGCVALPDSLKVDSEVSMFAVVDTWSKPATETNHLATLRMNFRGSKSMLLVRTLDVIDYMSNELMKEKVRPVDVLEFVKTLSKCTAVAYSTWLTARSGNSCPYIYQICVGPSDLVYVPAGYVFMEECHRPIDSVGIRRQILRQSDLPTLEKLSKHLASVEKKSPGLQEVVDMLIMRET